MAQHIVTGATGFLGSHLISSLCADSDPETGVYALARGGDGRSPADRVARALNHAGPGGALSPRVIESSLDAPLCGVVPQHIPAARGPRVVWHLAASLRWNRGEREQIMRTNIGGTKNALDLAAASGADLFVHVSTAYSCGSLSGDIGEELHHPPGFHNSYEESKCAAEHVVAGYKGVRTLILRPSVIVGTSHDHSPSGSYTGLYGYLSELRRFKSMLGDSEESVRFVGDRSTRISFIPVDHVVTDMRAAVGLELGRPVKFIYHITGQSLATVGGITDHMFDLLGLTDRLRIVTGPLSDPSTLERFFARRMEFFSHYVRDERRFARDLPPHRGVPLDEIERYIESENTLGSPGAPSCLSL